MAWADITTLTIKSYERKFSLFPAFSMAGNGTEIFTLEAVPLTVNAQFFVLEVAAFLLSDGRIMQRPTIDRWQPGGFPLAFRVSSFKKTNPPETVRIGVRPTGTWNSRFFPRELVVKLRVSDDNSQPAIATN